jgi:hypothetical protein
MEVTSPDPFLAQSVSLRGINVGWSWDTCAGSIEGPLNSLLKLGERSSTWEKSFRLLSNIQSRFEWILLSSKLPKRPASIKTLDKSGGMGGMYW